MRFLLCDVGGKTETIDSSGRQVLKIFNVLKDLLGVRPAVLKLVKAGFILFMIAHVGGSIWWLVKVSYNNDTLDEFKREFDVEVLPLRFDCMKHRVAVLTTGLDRFRFSLRTSSRFTS